MRYVRSTLGLSAVEPLNKGHFGICHFVIRWEVVLFSELKHEALLWERGPEACPLSGGCPYLGGSFIGGSTVAHKLKSEKFSSFCCRWQWLHRSDRPHPLLPRGQHGRRRSVRQHHHPGRWRVWKGRREFRSGDRGRGGRCETRHHQSLRYNTG